MSRSPTDAYGRSKLEAEQGLDTMAIDWVALRPVLVYGPGVKGNMAALLRLAQSPWPLPLGGTAMPSGRCSPSTISRRRSTPYCASRDRCGVRSSSPIRSLWTSPGIVGALRGRARSQTGSDPGAVVHAAPRRNAGGTVRGIRQGRRFAGGATRRVERPWLAAGQLDARRTGTSGSKLFVRRLNSGIASSNTRSAASRSLAVTVRRRESRATRRPARDPRRPALPP